MDLQTLAIVTAALLLYALVSGRLRGTIITAPLVFIVFGFAVGGGGLDIVSMNVGHSGIHFVAEFTLILVLFTDASRIDLGRVRQDHNLPTRMLAVGLPLTIVAGTVVALLAALLAPTDAALGQAVVSATEVPVRIRQAVNIESGLNDGIALPVVLLFAAMAGAIPGATAAGEWLRFGLLQVTLGPLVGASLGYAGARLLDEAGERGWTTTSFQGVGILALAVGTYAAAELAGGNGFIAVFVAGMVFGNTIRHPCTFLFDFMETEGQLLMLLTFLIFGAALLPEAMAHIGLANFGYALLSLTVIRMLPIAVSLVGSGVRAPTMLFLGWFGPRGLASILFVLLILEGSDVPHREQILSVTVLTVALSALLHGISAAPFARRYGRLAKSMGECQENQDAVELPLREGHLK